MRRGGPGSGAQEQVLLGTSSSMPLAVAGFTVYAAVCAAALPSTATVVADTTRAVLPFGITRAVILVGFLVVAGAVGEPVLGRLRDGVVSRRRG